MIGKFVTARCAPGTRAAAAVCRLAPLAAAVAMGFTGSASAATILVNNASAAGGVPGSCTLVDAATSINQANLVGACTNSGGAFGTNDKIDLSTFVSATTITFKAATVMTSTSALALTKPVTISGNPDSSGKPLVTITRTNEAPLNVRLIDTTANLTLHAIHLFNGRAQPSGNGGAIQAGANANLTLINSTVSLSFAVGSGGGIEAQGAVSLINSTVYGNTAAGAGGGVHSAGASGSVTATGTTISGNTTSGNSGGGISANTVTLTNSTVSGNSAQLDGGGIYTQNATLNFSTIAENSAAGNGGGLYFGPLVPTPILAATATVIYGNTPNDVDGSAGQTLSGDHNLIGASTHNIAVPADTLGCDPKLDLLADDGGPSLTQALLTGSCAIDAGPTFPPGDIPSDQRGNQYARRVGSATDIGAFEAFLARANDRIFYDGFGL